MITDEEIKALRKLEREATRGPWVFERLEFDEGDFAYERNDDACLIQIYEHNFEIPMKAKFDTAFISAARDALPKLLDEVERLKVERDDAIEKAVSFAVDHPCYKLSKELEAENEKLRDREKIMVEALKTIEWNSKDDDSSDLAMEALKRVEELKNE